MSTSNELKVIKHYEIEWFDVKKPPGVDIRVLIMATKRNFYFGWPQLFAGRYVYKYYDTLLDEFRIMDKVDNDGWVPLKWAFAPKTPKFPYEE